MAWEISEAAYTSPSGKRQTFDFEKVERGTSLKTSTFTFPGVDGALVQSHGLGARKFPLTCIFHGADCMKQADAFEKLLFEKGVGILEHPVYGTYNVSPTGEIKRSDDLVAALNEATVAVTFTETIVDKNFPDSKIATEDELEKALSDFDESAAREFAETIDTDSVATRQSLQSAIMSKVNDLSKGAEKMLSMAGVAKTAVKTARKNIKAYTGKIDGLVASAINAAMDIIRIARIPSRAAIDVMAKVEGYTSVIDSIIRNVKKNEVGIGSLRNQYAATMVAISGAVTSLCSGVAYSVASGDGNTGILSRSDVDDVMDSLVEQFENYKEYVDKEIGENYFVDNADTYENAYKVATVSLKLLQESSFALPSARVIKLDRDRQLIELLAELYGERGFDKMDQFITDNKLTGDEIVLLPMGREVRYYVESV